MAWVVWLAVPVVLTAVVAVLSWVRSRPIRTPGTGRAVRDHADYLDALVQTARSKDRGPYAGETAVAGGGDEAPTPGD